MPTTSTTPIPIPPGHVACPCCGEPTPLFSAHRSAKPRLMPRTLVACASCGAPVESGHLVLYLIFLAGGVLLVTVLCAAPLVGFDVAAYIAMGTAWLSCVLPYLCVRWIPSRLLRQHHEERDLVHRIMRRDPSVPQHKRLYYELMCDTSDQPRISQWLDTYMPISPVDRSSPTERH